MREILFRGKRLDNGELAYGYYVKKHVSVCFCDHFIVSTNVDENNELTETWHKVDPSTVGQFTGLTDKNGVKIFEGDVVKYKHNVAQVVCNHVSFCFEWLDDLTKRIRLQKIEPMFQNTNIIFEVIGNIYDTEERHANT